MSQERWAELCGLFREMQGTFRDDHRRAWILARTLRIDLHNYLGCDIDNITLYDYDEEKHTYKLENSPIDAVSMNADYKWFFGVGITLEPAPNTFPKTCFQFPVWLHINAEPNEIDTSFGRVAIPAGSPTDLSGACELIYHGFIRSLKNRTAKTLRDQKFGFLDFKE